MRIVRISSLIAAIAIILSFTAFASSPDIISQPQNVYFPTDIELPARATFSVLASGDNLTYQWQVQDSNGWRNVASGGNDASYVPLIYNAGVNGKYLFRVIVSNTEGTVVSQTVSASVGAFVLDSLPQFLSFVSDTANSIFSWARDACNCIVEQPLLLFTVGFLALGGSIAIASRLLSRS